MHWQLNNLCGHRMVDDDHIYDNNNNNNIIHQK